MARGIGFDTVARAGRRAMGVNDARRPGRRLHLWVLSSVAAMHVACLWGLTRIEAGRRLLAEVAPLFVDIIEPRPVPPPPKPPPEQPRTRREPTRHPPRESITPPPVLTSEAPATIPLAETAAPNAAPPPQPAPGAAVAPVPAAAAPPPPAPEPEPVIPPGFNAAYLDNPAPAYPMASRRLGEQGRVVLRVLVSAHGQPHKVELNQSSGFARLDQVAIDTVHRWRFVPARRGEEAVAAWVLVPISFRLGG